MTTTNITIEVSATIELNGYPKDALLRHLRLSMDRAIGDGLLTGHSEAEAEQYHVDITMNRHDLEDEITRYLAGQIEDGKLDAEGMARRLTRYGLMLPSDFTAENHERAEQTDD
jgi:hypothetical protein